MLIIFIDFRVLDLSNNRIKEIEGLDELINLEKLFLSSNRINKISNLNHLSKLKLLELGDNKIKVIYILNNLHNIEFYMFKLKIDILLFLKILFFIMIKKTFKIF